MFDACYCINLNRRPDRWECFARTLPAYWPYAQPERWEATDGRDCERPAWWIASPGAYGCLRSHLALWRHALEQSHDATLVFEDDVIFSADFLAKAATFLEAVPADWDLLYLGGQHLFTDERPPVQVNAQVLRGSYVNRTHAYAVRGKALTALIEAAAASTAGAPREQFQHVDHRMCSLHTTLNVYCPIRFICGQEAGRSDVHPQRTGVSWWNQFPYLSPEAAR